MLLKQIGSIKMQDLVKKTPDWISLYKNNPISLPTDIKMGIKMKDTKSPNLTEKSILLFISKSCFLTIALDKSGIKVVDNAPTNVEGM